MAPHTGGIVPAFEGNSPAAGRDPGAVRIDRDLAALIDEHAEAVFRVANGILRNPSLAEDAVQETMIKAWQSLPRFRGESSLRSWILRIAHNTAISMLRRRRESVMAPEDMPEIPGGIDPARSSAALSDLAVVREHSRDSMSCPASVVILREVEGMSYQEIAETLQVPVPPSRPDFCEPDDGSPLPLEVQNRDASTMSRNRFNRVPAQVQGTTTDPEGVHADE